MPYRRRYKSYSRKPRRRRRNIFWRRGANKALYMAKKALSMLNVEFKNHDVPTAATIPDATGTIQQLTNINQGDTTNTRDGAQVKLTSIFIRGNIKQNASATQTVVRLMLVLDKQTNQTIYTLADLLQDVTASDSVLSVNNLDNKHRFIVLWDRSFSLSDSGRQVIAFKFHKKLNLKIRYDNTGNGIADLTSYSLSLVRLSDEATNVPSLRSITRIRYVDN